MVILSTFPRVYLASLSCLWSGIQIFCPLKKLGCKFSYGWAWWVFIYSGCHLSYMLCKYFLPFCGLSFHFLDNVLWSTKVQFWGSPVYFFPLVVTALVSLPKKPLLNPRSRFMHMLLSKNCVVLQITSVVHFELNFVFDMR